MNKGNCYSVITTPDGYLDFLVESAESLTLQVAADSYMEMDYPWDTLSDREGGPLLRAYYPDGGVEILYIA